MSGGLTIDPVYVKNAAVERAVPGCTPGSRPVVANTVGISVDSPAPQKAIPMVPNISGEGRWTEIPVMHKPVMSATI